jgi:hypothetical protein
LTKEGERPHVTLATGAVVDAREAAGVWRELSFLLTIHPDRFRSLLALAQDRPGEADARHLDELWADWFLDRDRRTIRPAVRQVLLNSYQDTREGPVIAPLRLHDEADRPVAEQALQQHDQLVWNLLFRREDRGQGIE